MVESSALASAAKRLIPGQATFKIGILCGVLIFLLAGVTRLGWPGIVEFKGDEAALSTLALDMTHGHGIPLLGINSSVGIPNPPMSVYLMAIPYSVSTDPIVATAFVAMLNVIAVLLLYMLVWRYYGLAAAVIAGLLYAADPWAILFSRKIWEQNLLPVFVIAIIGTGLIGLVEGKRWAQWLHLPLLSIAGQLHYGSFVLIPVTVWFIAVGIRRKQIHPALSGGLIIAVLLALPYLIGMGQAGLLDLSRLRASIASASINHAPLPLAFSVEGFQDAALVIGGADVYSQIGDSHRDYLAADPIANWPLPDLIASSVTVSAIWLVIRTIQHRGSADDRRPRDVGMLLWLIVTPLVYSLSWTPVFTHYYIAMIPGAFAVLSAAVSDLWAWVANRPRLFWLSGSISGFLAAGFAVTEAATFIALLGFIDTHVNNGEFGLPLHDLMPARQMVLNSGATSILAKFDGQFMLADPESTVWNALLYPIPSVRFIDNQTDIYPAAKTYIFTRTCQGSSGDAALLTGQSNCFSLTPRQSSDFNAASYVPISPTRANQSIRFDNGAYLIGYRWQATPNACLILAWGVDKNFASEPNAPDAQDYHFAVHFTNARDQEIVIADALSWRSAFWRPGDVVVRTFCVPDSAKARAITGVRLGMYTYNGQTFHNANLIDQQGTPVAQTIALHFSRFF